MLTPQQRQFVKIMEGGFREHGNAYWRDFLELAFHAMRQDQTDQDPKTEAAYMAVVERYTRRNQYSVIREQFPEALALILASLRDAPDDFLGAVASEMETLHKGLGQFFTPYELARLNARMVLSDAGAIIEEKGSLSISEPACGAGGMLIAALEYIKELGHPVHKVYLNAWDISVEAVHMCYIQLAAIGAVADVVHGNTLTLETWGTYPTPLLRDMRKLRQNAPRPPRRPRNRVLPDLPPPEPPKPSGRYARRR